ncbi:MAG: 2-oxo acid dehydrogenase subunit E2 [Firmicutes bacterium]|nr:2-oxo acid dehydrogenase subunit E2 [Bacillota bacterium]
MFFNRKDGKKIKGLKGVEKLMPFFMPSREGSTNKFLFDETTKHFDAYILEKQQTEGITYTYRDLTIATLVRVFKCLPKLNRFITAKRFYQRNSIDVTMMVHSSIQGKGDDVETTVKVSFTGEETVREVKEKLDAEIERAIKAETDAKQKEDSLAKLPTFIMRLFTRTLRIFDYFGWLSKKFLFKISPFHTSIFFADLKSIHVKYIYHHLYNFGNCSFFCAMGKEQTLPVVNEKNEIIPDKRLQLGISVDDRCVDGLYFSFMLKAAKRIVNNMSILERPPHDHEIRKH